MNHSSSDLRRRDAGAALPLVIILSSVMAIVVVALITFTLANLSASRVAENRSDRLSAADAGMRYAIDQLKLRNAGCILDTQEAVLPGVDADFNGATASVRCERITSGFEGIQAYAAVMTGLGVPTSSSLLESQSGSNAKVLGGPVYMSRIDTGAFDLDPPVEIKDGPLLYHDTTGAEPCGSVKPSILQGRTGGKLEFTPELIFGPQCVSVGWTEIFDSPAVPDLSGLIERDGSLAVPLVSGTAVGSYTDYSGSGGCRVFEPGRYTTSPDLNSGESYFMSGEYLFDFNDSVSVKQGALTAGKINPLTTPDGLNVNPTTAECEAQQAADMNPGLGATFYFAQGAKMNIEANGAIEIHARQQGTSDYVSVQALCDPTAFPVTATPEEIWCNADGGGSFATPKYSTLSAPALPTDNILYTDPGNNKDFVAHALFYAPAAQVEFGNVSSTAVQKMLGGLIVARLKLQSATSASNFEISVPTSPITAEILLTSTAIKDGTTSIQTVVQYRPYESSVDERIRINSSRVCGTLDCGTPIAPTACAGGDLTWTASFYSNPNLSGSINYSETPSTLNYNWGSGSPDPAIPANSFSARFERTVDLPGAGTYQFTIGTDDGQRFYVDGAVVSDQWITQPISTGVYTVDVVISDPCNVDLMLEYYEASGQAVAFVNWTKIS